MDIDNIDLTIKNIFCELRFYFFIGWKDALVAKVNGIMKKNGFKIILALGFALATWNCSSDSGSSVNSIVISEEAAWYDASTGYVIYPSGAVKDVYGNQLGTAEITQEKIVVVVSGNTQEYNPSTLVIVTPENAEEVIANGANATPVESSASNEPSVDVGSSESKKPASSASAPLPAGQYEKLTASTAGVKKGFATRYWDACKQHCSWPEKVDANANPYKIEKVCNIDGDEIPAFTKSVDETWLQGVVSACDGGYAYTCIDMIPRAVNDTLAYAYAAAPGSEANGVCGKCFQIQFTGVGKYGTKTAHKKLQGKTLIVMATNIGYDVSENQFDVMIPGGGVGAFDALSKQLGVNNSQLGAQYGGLYTDCENSLGADAPHEKLKSCVAEKCNALFTKRPTLLEGCLWFTTWYEAANNPELLYKEVTCPQALVDGYPSTINTSNSLSAAPSYKASW